MSAQKLEGKDIHWEKLDLLDKIHSDALRVLEEVGVKCTSSTVREIFEATGLAAYDDTTGHIHVLKPLVEQALSSTPKRDQYWIPENSFGVGGTAPFVYDDVSGELIQPTFDHLAKIEHLDLSKEIEKRWPKEEFFDSYGAIHYGLFKSEGSWRRLHRRDSMQKFNFEKNNIDRIFSLLRSL